MLTHDRQGPLLQPLLHGPGDDSVTPQAEGRKTCPYDYNAILRSSVWVPLVKWALVGLRARTLAARLRRGPGLRHLTGGWGSAQPLSVEVRRLNLGCGDANYAGFVNLDVVSRSHLDILADGRHLPFTSEVFDDVLCADVIEHLDANGGRRLLEETARVLKHHGRLILVTPDLRLLMHVYCHQMASHGQVMQHLYGDGHDHRYLYTSPLLAEAVRSAGLQVRRTVQRWGPIWAHVVLLAEKP